MAIDNKKWTLIFRNAIKGNPIAFFECKIDSLSRYIGKPGTLSASIDVTALIQAPGGESNLKTSISQRLQPIIYGAGRVSLDLTYNGAIWWSGILTEVNITSMRSGAEFQVSGVSWEGYLDGVSPSQKSYAVKQVEQLELARLIWQLAQDPSRPNAQVGINTPPVNPSGILRDISWKRSGGRTWASILNEMANRDKGFEWMIDSYEVDGKITRQLALAYPTFQRTNARYRFNFPGNIIDYSVKVDALSGATRFQARGDAPDPVGGVEQDPLLSDYYEYQWTIDQGYIARDYTVDRNGVSIKATLDSWAKKYADVKSGPMIITNFRCHIDSIYGGAILGQKVVVGITDALFITNPLDGSPQNQQELRIIGLEIKPRDRTGFDEVTLIIERPEDLL